MEIANTKMIREYLTPVAVLDSDKAVRIEKLTEKGYNQMLLEAESEITEISEGGYVIVDFGKEIAGCVRIIAALKCVIRLRVGESYAEACSDIGVKGACNDHATRDASGIFIPAWSDTEHFNSAFRFVRIDVLEGTLKLKRLLAGYTHTTIPRTGFFTCADEKVNRIYETAAHTVTLCLQNGVIWDGVKRDRLAWVGDMYSEILALTNLYSDYDNIRNMLDMTRETTPLPNWMNTIPTYSLWWIMCLSEYVFRSGDKDTYARSKQYVLGLMEIFDGYTSEEGLITTKEKKAGGMPIFLDWPTYGKPDEIYGATALLKMTAEAAVKLLKIDGTTSEHAENILRKLKNTKGEPTTQKPAIAACVYAGQPADAKRLLEGGSKGVSTFMSWIILMSLHDSGYKKEAAEIAKEYYGAMLDLGATTFWEDFDIDWKEGAAPITRLPKEGEIDVHGDYGKYCYTGYRHSFCHGWSAGVIEYIIRDVLGVKRTGVDANTVEVSPYPAYGDMKGTVPVGSGFVTVEVVGGKVNVTATEGINVIVK